MKQILCYGDSNTYGLIPRENGRYPWGIRWTSQLNERLGLDKFRVVEEGLCGRTTVFDDPFRDFRNGSAFVQSVLETHGASDLVILMLGTNDCKTVYKTTPEIIARGIKKITEQIRAFAKDSQILLVSPIHLGENVWKEEYDPEFSTASIEVSKHLGNAYQKLADREGLYFLDASAVAEPSEEDQEHLNETGHGKLADAIYDKVCEILQAA